MKKFLRNIWTNIQARKIEKLVDTSELSRVEKQIARIQREAHESEKIGCCTVTTMSSKAELKSRLLRLEAEAEIARKKSREKSEAAWLQPPISLPTAYTSEAARAVAGGLPGPMAQPSGKTNGEA